MQDLTIEHLREITRANRMSIVDKKIQSLNELTV